jgi:hypothetical protein
LPAFSAGQRLRVIRRSASGFSIRGLKARGTENPVAQRQLFRGKRTRTFALLRLQSYHAFNYTKPDSPKTLLMKTTSLSFALLIPVAAAAVCMLPGCASPTYQKADATALSLQSSAKLIEDTRAQLSSLSDSLALLQRNEELGTHYASFVKQLALFEKNAADINSSALAMQSKSTAYIAQWQRDLETITSPSLRQSSSDRLNQVSSAFAGIKASYEETKLAFVPFFSHLKDIQTALGADLTPAGAASVQPFIDKATVDIEPVKRALEKLAAEFSALSVSLGSAAAGGTP